MDIIQKEAFRAVTEFFARKQTHVGHDDLLLVTKSLALHLDESYHDQLIDVLVAFQKTNSNSRNTNFDTEIRYFLRFKNKKAFNLGAFFSVVKKLDLDISQEERTAISALNDGEISEYIEPTLIEQYQERKEDLDAITRFEGIKALADITEKTLTANRSNKEESSAYADLKHLTDFAGDAFIGKGGFIFVPMQGLLPVEGISPLNHQTIDQKGVKLFPKDSMVAGAVHPLPNRNACYESHIVLVCEGLSTGEILYRETGYPTICTLSKCNTDLAGISLIEHSEVKYILYCADRDDIDRTNKKVEVLKAGAARDVKIGVAIPSSAKSNGDFWDVFNESGQGIVRNEIEHAYYLLRSETTPTNVTEVDNPLDDEKHYCKVDLLKHLDDKGLPKQLALSIARATYLPPNTVFLAMLGSYSAMATRAYSVAYRNGKPLPTGIYAAMEQPPGASKSRCLDTFQEPFYTFYTHHKAECDAAISDLKQKISDLSGDSTKKSELHAAQERLKELEALKQIPLFQTNTTPEALEALLLKSSGHFSCVSSEQGILNSLFGLAYGDGKESNNDIALNGYNGHPVSSHRVSREGYTGKVTGAVVCFAQEGTVQKILTQSNGTGLSERFLMLAEPHNIGRRDFTQYHDIDDYLLTWYADCCTSVTTFLKKPLPFDNLQKLTLSNDSWNLINLARNEIEPLLIDGGKYSHESLRGAASKIDMQIMKIAANLHLLDKRHAGISSVIDDSIVTAAIGIALELLEANYRTMQDKGIVGRKAEWQTVLDYLAKQHGKVSKFTEIRIALRNLKIFKASGDSKVQIQTTLDEMVSAGLIVLKASGGYAIK